MTTKKNIIYWLLIFCGIGVFYTLLQWFHADKIQSNYAICYGTWSTFEAQVTACGNIIKDSQKNYALIVSQLSWYAESASGAREKIRVVAQDFYSKNLSGTNVNFITTK